MDVSQRKRVLQVKFCLSLRTSKKELIDVSTTQMSALIIFASAVVLFEGGFYSLWVSLRYLTFCTDFCGYIGKRLDKKPKANFKIHDVI